MMAPQFCEINWQTINAGSMNILQYLINKNVKLGK